MHTTEIVKLHKRTRVGEVNVTKVAASLRIRSNVVDAVFNTPQATLVIESETHLVSSTIRKYLKVIGVFDFNASEGLDGANNTSARAVGINIGSTANTFYIKSKIRVKFGKMETLRR